MNEDRTLRYPRVRAARLDPRADAVIQQIADQRYKGKFGTALREVVADGIAARAARTEPAVKGGGK